MRETCPFNNRRRHSLNPRGYRNWALTWKVSQSDAHRWNESQSANALSGGFIWFSARDVNHNNKNLRESCRCGVEREIRAGARQYWRSALISTAGAVRGLNEENVLSEHHGYISLLFAFVVGFYLWKCVHEPPPLVSLFAAVFDHSQYLFRIFLLCVSHIT